MAALNRSQLLERARKLAERAKRDIGPEAANALRAYVAFIREHGISTADLKPPPAGPVVPDVKRAPIKSAAKSQPGTLQPKKGPDKEGVPVRIKVGGIEVRFRL